MLLPIVPMALLAFAGWTPRQVELRSEAVFAATAEIHCIAVERDTAYLCQGGSVLKLVYDAGRIRIVDSLPSRQGNGWTDAEYVSIGSARGVLAVVDYRETDTAAWLVDWSRKGDDLGSSPASRWVSHFSLPGGVAFSRDCPLTGRTLDGMDALFGTDKGLYQLTPMSTSAGPGIGVRASLGTSSTSSWKSWMLDSSRVVGIATDGNRLLGWKGAMYYDFLSAYEASDAMPLGGGGEASPWSGAAGVVSSRGCGTLLFSKEGDRGLSVHGGKADTFALPGLLVRRFGTAFLARVSAARSTSGLVAAVGDSMFALLDWNGADAPVVVHQQEQRYAPMGVAFGDSVLWIADKGGLRAWRLVASPAAVSSLRKGALVGWSVSVRGRTVRLEGKLPAVRADILDASGRILAASRVRQGGATEIPVDVSGLVLVRCGGETRRVVVGR